MDWVLELSMKKTSTDKQKCKKCSGAGRYMYDENHIKPCEICCTHLDGWWKMEKHYGSNNGKYACKRGCGTIVDNLSQTKKVSKKLTSSPQSEEDLMKLTKEALANVLDREPTKQEILRAHAGFKRMAFLIYENLRRENL